MKPVQSFGRPISTSGVSEHTQSASCLIVAASFFRRAHSQTVATRQPASISLIATCRSLSTFRLNFSDQKSARVEGVVAN